MGLYNKLYLKKYSLIPKITYRIIKCLSNTQTLEPIKMSYATYESTTSDKGNEESPLLIMHGLFGSKSNWNSLSKAFIKKFNPPRKVIAVDVRNHGDSPHDESHTYTHLAADIKALLEQLNIQKVSLMGHSMGGRAVMLFALQYPELVDNLVVADVSPLRTSPVFDSMTNLLEALETLILPSEVPMSKARSFVEEQLTKYVHEKSVRSFLLTNLIQKDDGSYGWRINIQALLRNLKNISNFPVVEGLQYDGPVLFIAGSSSDYVKYWNLKLGNQFLFAQSINTISDKATVSIIIIVNELNWKKKKFVFRAEIYL